MKRVLVSALFFALALLVSSVSAAEVPRHGIRVSIDAASGKVEVTDRVQVSGQADFRFRLASWLEIGRVRLNGEQAAAKPVGGGYRVALPGDGTHQLDIELSGQLPARADGSVDSSSHAGDGSFLPSWDGWVPHDPAQPLVFRLVAEITGGQRAVATGRLVSEAHEGDRFTAEFEQSRPGEAPSLFVGPYQVREAYSGDIRLRTWFHPGLEDFADGYLASAAEYLGRYHADIGAYPYSDFHIVSAPLPVGLGFAGLTYVDRRIVPRSFMQTRSLAHEVLHSWWGNAVAVDYASGNWSEGLTTYQADYALERFKGDAAARAMRARWLRDYAALPTSRDQAIRNFVAKEHQAGQVVGYNKVAFVFHMLEREIGEAAFDDGIRRFWRDHRFRTAGWSDLQRAFEQAANRDLGAFFRQWIDQRGAPRLSLGKHSVTAVEGGYQTQVEILQPVAGFRFMLPVSLTTESGSETNEIEIDSIRTVLEWKTPTRPLSIHFDANLDLFRRLDPAETPPILRDVTLHPKAQVLIAGDAAFTDTARQLAARLLDTAPAFLSPGDTREPQRPLLLIVAGDRLEQQLARRGIEMPAALPPASYAASAWTARFANGTPLLVVSADSVEELQALLRPLPHYGGQSYVLFDAGRAQKRGVWPMERGALYRDLAGN